MAENVAQEYRTELVNLFYVGGLPEEDGPQYVTTGGSVLVVPPRGEYLTLKRYQAEDLMKRYNVKGIEPFSLLLPKPEAAPKNYTREELLSMLAAMESAPVDEKPAPAPVEEITIPVVEETPIELDLTGEPDAAVEEPAPQPAAPKATKRK